MGKFSMVSRLFILCVMTVFISICSMYSLVAAAPQDAKEMVVTAYQKMLNFNNYHMALDSTATMSVQGKNIRMAMEGGFDIQAKPMLSKGDMNIRVYTDSKTLDKNLVQYIEESGNQIIIYSNVDNSWIKQSFPKESVDSLRDYGSYIKAIKSAEIESDDDNSTVIRVVASGEVLKNTLKQKMALMGMNKLVVSDDFLADIQDLSYSITIDKSTGNISASHMDLSDFMAQFGTHMADKMKTTEKQKQAITEMFQNMKFIMDVTFSQYNSAPDVVIPQDVKERAVEKNVQSSKLLSGPQVTQS
ncbi:hypothetical protein Ga0466249_003718 [Sporomusaceae bacterium BoRhaA]|uniref:DUF6612 family protein n=1 Tax=Pelorhabdus rhamnosifermentans TaxID=2772457 RepID=UPI001C06246B|nr:DUF6612 family protein [Pelorhabdus rhamnosifermentans]MBU2702584.1 hypothetical protein [Pelorhabdus rhamnosifermentans]